MKRILPYLLLQFALSGSLGCAGMRTAQPATAYRVIVTTPLAAGDTELRSLAAGLPGQLIDVKTGLLPWPQLQLLEFRLHDQGSLQQFRQMLGHSGIPVNMLQVEEIRL